MAIVRHTLADIDVEAALAHLAKAREYTEEEIEQHAIEDGGALTDEQLAQAVAVYPRLDADAIKAVRHRLGFSQSQFARCFGFGLDTLQQYEQGRRTPSGPASTLLRVIAADPDAVMRALDGRWPRDATVPRAAE